jgi:hypothetical protein
LNRIDKINNIKKGGRRKITGNVKTGGKINGRNKDKIEWIKQVIFIIAPIGPQCTISTAIKL